MTVLAILFVGVGGMVIGYAIGHHDGRPRPQTRPEHYEAHKRRVLRGLDVATKDQARPHAAEAAAILADQIDSLTYPEVTR